MTAQERINIIRLVESGNLENFIRISNFIKSHHTGYPINELKEYSKGVEFLQNWDGTFTILVIAAVCQQYEICKFIIDNNIDHSNNGKECAAAFSVFLKNAKLFNFLKSP